MRGTGTLNREAQGRKDQSKSGSRTAAVQQKGAARQAFASRKDLNRIRKTVGFSFRNSAGSATATAREVLAEARSVTVRQTAGRWFISILTEREVKKPVHPSNPAAGIGMGIVRFATLSDGEFVEPFNSFKKHQLQEEARPAVQSPAGFEPQGEVEQELKEGESQGPAHLRPHSQRSSGTSA